MKPIVRMYQWTREQRSFSEGPRDVLSGVVVGHPRIRNGGFVTTSPIIGREGRRVHTENTVYDLNDPLPDPEWLNGLPRVSEEVA